MISVKAHYNQSRIVFLDPIKADIVTAELNIVIIPSEKKHSEIFSQKNDCASRRSGEEEFKQLGLAAFFDTDDDANVDWENYFGIK